MCEIASDIHYWWWGYASLQFSLGVDGKKMEPESNVLLASIENMQYAVTLDVLQTVPTFELEKAFIYTLVTGPFL